MRPELSDSEPAGQPATAGFTLIELLVVIAIIAILAAMLLSALARAKGQASQTFCKNSVKELAIGMTMYLGDYLDKYPACASRSSYGFQPEDWIYWRSGLDAVSWNGVLETLDKSPIVAYLSTKMSTNIFRCPADISDDGRIQEVGEPVYYYSYSMTGYGLDSTGTINQGLTGVQDNNGINWYPYKNSGVRNPSGKISFAEEPTLPPIDTPPANQLPGGASIEIIDDGRWEPYPYADNYLTTRHDGNADSGFVDGHVASVNWKFATNEHNTLPGL